MKGVSILAFAALFVSGCGSPDAVPAHTAQEDQAINEAKNLTPEQQIDRIQKGAMPESAKTAMIQQIKDKNGIK